MTIMASVEELNSKLDDLRAQFNEQYKASIQDGAYDIKDLDRVVTDDGLLRNFLRHQKSSVENAAAMMDTSFKWRKEMNLGSLTEKSFPREMHEMGACFYRNKDKDGNKILYFEVKKSKKDAEKLPLVKQFIAWWIDKHFLKNPEERLVVLFDMTDAGLSNMDIDLVKFQISCFTTYYPAFLAYMLIYEMPWVLSAIWKVIKNLLSAEQQNYVLFVKKNEIQRYITKDQLWVHMGGLDDYKYSYLPTEDSGIDMPNGDVPHENQSESSINKKRVTFAEKNQTMYTSFDGDSLDSQEDGMETPTTAGTPRNRRSARTKQSVFKGSHANVSPSDQFVFQINEEGREAMDTLTITNTSSTPIAFKVKTTSPESYRVRPSTGLIPVADSADVNVYLQSAAQNAVSRDKFLVMVLAVEDDVKSVSKVAEKFRSASKDNSKYMEHRLWCTVTKTSPHQEGGTIDLKILQEHLIKLSKQMDTMVDSQSQLQRRLSNMMIFQVLLTFLLLGLGVVLVYFYYMEYHPMKELAAASCTPLAWKQ